MITTHHALILLAALIAPLSACLDDAPAVKNNQDNAITQLGFRGEMCTKETGCSDGLACQGGFCQATCDTKDDCAMYQETYCIAPQINTPMTRFCLRAGEFTCNQAQNADAFCVAQVLGTDTCRGNECADSQEPMGCTQDDTCAQDEFCADGMCAPGCSMGRCADGETCDLATRVCRETCQSDEDCDSLLDACLPKTDELNLCTTLTSCDEAADPNLWCQRNQGTLRTQCSAGTCEATNTPITAIQIVDLSSGDEACQPERSTLSDSGADIVAVELFDEGGVTQGFGRVEVYTQGSGANDYISTAHLSGEPPDIDNFGCPNPVDGESFRQDSVTSLGCNGYMIVSFPDDDLEPLALMPEWTVAVSEFAPVCLEPDADTQGEDRYEVYACEDLDQDGAISNAECDQLISEEPAGGYTFHTIPD